MTASKKFNYGRELRILQEAGRLMSDLTGVPIDDLFSRKRDRRTFYPKAVLTYCTWLHNGNSKTAEVFGISRSATMNRVEIVQTALTYLSSGYQDIKELYDKFAQRYEEIRIG